MSRYDVDVYDYDAQWTDDDALIVLLKAHEMLEYGDNPKTYIADYLREIGRL